MASVRLFLSTFGGLEAGGWHRKTSTSASVCKSVARLAGFIVSTSGFPCRQTMCVTSQKKFFLLEMASMKKAFHLPK